MSPSPAGAASFTARPTNVRWRILGVMIFISFVSYLCAVPVPGRLLG